MRPLDARMRAAEQRVREAARHRVAARLGDSNPLLDQLRDTVAKAEAQLAKAQGGGNPGR